MDVIPTPAIMQTDRRSFLRNLALAFTILPSAGRVWKAERKLIINPDWVNAEYEMAFASYVPIFHWLPSFQDFLAAKQTNHDHPVHHPNPSQNWPAAGEGPVIYRRSLTYNTE